MYYSHTQYNANWLTHIQRAIDGWTVYKSAAICSSFHFIGKCWCVFVCEWIWYRFHMHVLVTQLNIHLTIGYIFILDFLFRMRNIHTDVVVRWLNWNLGLGRCFLYVPPLLRSVRSFSLNVRLLRATATRIVTHVWLLFHKIRRKKTRERRRRRWRHEHDVVLCMKSHKKSNIVWFIYIPLDTCMEKIQLNLCELMWMKRPATGNTYSQTRTRTQTNTERQTHRRTNRWI